MGDWHSAEITIGGTLHTVYADPDDRPVGDAVYVLDDLRLRTNWTEPAPVQGQYGPWSAQLALASSDLQALAAVNIGDPVCIEVWTHPPGSTFPHIDPPTARLPLVHWLGRVSDAVLTPTASVDPVTGTVRHRLALTMTDRLVDYNQITVGRVDWPQESLGDRVQRIHDEAGLLAYRQDYYGMAAARKASPIGYVDAFSDALISTSDPDPDVPWKVYFPAPNIGFDVVDPATSYVRFHKDFDAQVPVMRGSVNRDQTVQGEDDPELPGLLVGFDAYDEASGTFVPRVDLVIDPIADDYTVTCIDAARIDGSDLEWSKSRADRIDRVEVTTADDPPRVWTASADYPLPVVHRIETQLVSVDSVPTWVARANFPPVVDNSYGVPEVAVLSLDDTGVYPWLLHYNAQYGIRRNVVVYNVDPARNPSGRDWFVGVPAQAEIVFRRGQWTYTLKLRADSMRPYPWTPTRLAARAPMRPGYLSWEALVDSPHAAATWRHPVPTLTWRDLRLARRP